MYTSSIEKDERLLQLTDFLREKVAKIKSAPE